MTDQPTQAWRDKFKALYVSPAIHRRMAVKAAQEGRQIMELAEEACTAYLDGHMAAEPAPAERKEAGVSIPT